MADTYALSPAFERIVAVMCCTKPGFYGKIGHAIVPDMLRLESCRLLVKAAQVIGRELGHGPSDARVVMQRLTTLMDDGQVTNDQRQDALDVFVDVDALPPEDEIIGELGAVLKRAMQHDAVRTAMDNFSKKGDFSEVVQIISKANSLGKVDTSIGEELTPGNFAEIDRMRNVDRLPVGIPEIDVHLNGGLPRCHVGMIVGGTGVGKSMFLTHVGATALRLGLFVVMATLELNKGLQQARMKANLTGVPILDILHDVNRDVVTKRLEYIYPTLGNFVVQYFPAKITTIPEIVDWVHRCEQVKGFKVDLVLLDYVDKVRSHNKEDKNDYAGQGTVMESYRGFLEDERKFGWTASQPQRRAAKERTRRIEADDVADSMNKARVVDLQLSAMREGDDQILYYCPKWRLGEPEWSVGPLPHDHLHARMVHIEDEEWEHGQAEDED